MGQRATQEQTSEANLHLSAPSTSLSPLSARGPVHPLLHLQQTIGNQAVQRLIQTKSNIGQPGDRYEQEADRVAEQVTRHSVPPIPARIPVSGQPANSPIQRACAECDEEHQEQPLEAEDIHQPVAGYSSPPELQSGPPAGSNNGNGSSRPLPAALRAFFESRFGYDFSRVRLHTGDQAAESARAVNALAYTAGRDIVFGAGQYRPETGAGRRLLAHELSHVGQQSAAGPRLQRQADPDAPPAEPAPEETAAPALIVDDEATNLGASQMRKSEFLARLRPAVCRSADEALAATGRSSEGCPYLDRWFAYYQDQDSRQVERAVHRYAPESRRATNAGDYIPIVAGRVRQGVERWARTGEITGVPEELRDAFAGGGLLEALGGLASGIGGAVASLAGGIGRGLSALGGVLFKGRQGGAREAGDPRAIQAQLGQGHSLEGGVKARMESAFGASFSQVRLHTDAGAAGLSSDLNARAFTIGSDIGFGSGEYQPGTPIGDALIAHELAHVIQQGSATIASASNDTVLEDDADRSAVGVAAFLWAGSQAWAAQVAQSNLPQVKTGLRLSRCAKKTPAPVTQAPGTAAEEEPERPITETDLENYLRFLDDTKGIESQKGSDAKARLVVERWKRGDSLFILPVRRKILLIEEMLSGSVSREDQQSILDLLRGSTDAELSNIFTAVGEAKLKNSFSGEEKELLEKLIESRRKAIAGAAKPGPEVFEAETILELQKRFRSNSESANRLNCILIIQELAPQLFAQDPVLAERVRAGLSGLTGKDLKMTEAGRVLSDLGLASQYAKIKFDNGNGVREPNRMETSAWDTIVRIVGNVQGWHVFGMAVFNGYHSVTLFVDNRPDGIKVYWADQWRIDPGDDFNQEPGSVSGFRRYENPGFDNFITAKTKEWWNDKFAEGKRWEATLHLWKFRSRLP